MSEVSLSTYPTTVDIFDRYSDLDATTMAMAEIYKGYIDAGQYETAATYLTNHPDLEACGITAEIINKHSDAIVAVETYLNDTRTYLNQTAGVVSGLITTTGRLQADINALENDAIITSEEKVIGSIGGKTHCQLSALFESLGDATSNILYVPNFRPGVGADGYLREVISVNGVFYDDGVQYRLCDNSSSFSYGVTTSGSMQSVDVHFTNASTSTNKRILVIIDYIKETA